MAGCTNPGAVNYDPAQTIDDGSCIYLEKVGANCYYFEDYDIDGVEDKGFTISYALESDNWVFFHSYIPDYYFHTREKLHLVKGRKVYTANEGTTPGTFLGQAAQPFFIDVVFNYKDEQTLNSLNWITERLGTNSQDQEFATLTHITIWNSQQVTGRIPISQVFTGQEATNIRKVKSIWHFNDFRDVVVTRGNKFLKDIFHDFAVDTAQISTSLPWYEKKLMEDNYFIVRFEFDNSANNVVFLHDVEANVIKSNR